MAFFPVNYGDSRMHQYPIEKNDHESWHDAFQSLSDIHESERIRDKEKHNKYLKNEKVFEDRMKLKDEFMKANSERFMLPNEQALSVPTQPQSWMDIDNSYKPGIGLLGKGEKNDYDVYDTDFHGGKKGKTKKTKKTKTKKTKTKTKKINKTKKSKKSKKTKKTKKTKKSKKTRLT
uniref:Uncharacterized protein n=1 Tax=viral metagenome TaxID=1070528 RepID=A0A6C0HQ17_9ZZZZ